VPCNGTIKNWRQNVTEKSLLKFMLTCNGNVISVYNPCVEIIKSKICLTFKSKNKLILGQFEVDVENKFL
jgi:hypothetical protein